uniref:SAP domain-containing protein n=1 Tax=Biomphalaria glabrata TaxID=6526 RepID=A0A2C9LKP3_BIOGL
MAHLKLLYEFEFRELKQELRGRRLKVYGNKETLQKRLREDMLEEKEDSDTYLFEVEPDLLEQLASSTQQLITSTRIMQERMAAMQEEITSNSKTDQVNVCSVSKHVAEKRLQVESGLRRLDPTDACPDSKTSERSPDGDHKNPMKSDEAVEGHLQAERYKPGPDPTD